MFRQLVEHVGGGSDWIRTEIEFQTGLLGSGDETIGRSLVTGDIHIASGLLFLRLHTIDVDGRRMGVVAIVITCLNHLDVSLGDGGFLGELLFQEISHEVQVAVKKPADGWSIRERNTPEKSIIITTLIFPV